MKQNHTTLRQNLRRFLPVVVTALVLLATTGCGGSGDWAPFRDKTPDWKASHRTLDAKVARLSMQLNTEKKLAERAAFWRTASALLLVVVFVALVGGAALGSRARRDSRLFRTAGEDTSPEPDTDEIAV